MYDATLDLEQAPAEEATDAAELELFVATASFAQRRLWLLDRMQPGSSAYNVPVAVRLRGPVRADILADALAELVARHETLRTFFDEEEGEPVQVIVPELRLDLPEIDLTALPAGRADAEALLQAQEEARRPFDLGRAPLLRAFLYPLRPHPPTPSPIAPPPTGRGGATTQEPSSSALGSTFPPLPVEGGAMGEGGQGGEALLVLSLHHIVT